jgi:beta-lactamase superfamily II metal-dependent hydrolase
MNKLVVTFYDVGHGNCTHIITPNNRHILVDIGSLEEYSISDFLKTILGLIDMLRLTHTHKNPLYNLASLTELGLLPRTLSIDRRAFPFAHLRKQRLYNSSNNQRQITSSRFFCNTGHKLPMPAPLNNKWQLQQSLDKKYRTFV